MKVVGFSGVRCFWNLQSQRIFSIFANATCRSIRRAGLPEPRVRETQKWVGRGHWSDVAKVNMVFGGGLYWRLQHNSIIYIYIWYICIISFTLLGINVSHQKSLLKMIFLFPRWDMLVPWRVIIILISYSEMIQTWKWWLLGNKPWIKPVPVEIFRCFLGRFRLNDFLIQKGALSIRNICYFCLSFRGWSLWQLQMLSPEIWPIDGRHWMFSWGFFGDFS